MNKQNAQLGVFIFIGIWIALSNQIIDFLNHFGLETGKSSIVIIVVAGILIWYNMKIAKLVAGV